MLTGFIGSDAITPFAERLKESDKDVFIASRTSNRSAAEMQDLRSGSRLAYMAKADIANRFAGSFLGKSGYSRIALIAAASSADCLRALRTKYTNLFLLLDGCDYPNANAKNCSAAFDQLGHGAIACAGLSVMAAWQENEDQTDPVAAAQKAAERHRRNILRYVTVL
jgi:orotidine-5'-phosphate decarboxylase